MEDFDLDFDPSLHSDPDPVSYRGAATRGRRVGDDGDVVGALRSLPPSWSREAETERSSSPLEGSERTWEASEMTCDDWSADQRDASVRGRERGDEGAGAENVVRLRIRVAELAARARWHEGEHVALAERTKRAQEEGLVKRLEGFRIQHFLQERVLKLEKEVERLRRENELLQAVNRGLLTRRPRRPSGKKSRSPSKIAFPGRHDFKEAGSSRLKENKELARNQVVDLPPRHFPAVIAFKRRSTVGEMETPSSSDVSGLPLPRQPRNSASRRRSTVDEMERPYLREYREGQATANAQSPASLASSITFRRRRSTVGEMEAPRHGGRRATVEVAANGLPLSRQPHTITFRRRSTVGETGSPYRRENQEAVKSEVDGWPRPNEPHRSRSNRAFKGKSSGEERKDVEDAEDVGCTYHHEHQQPRNTPPNSTSKGRGAGGGRESKEAAKHGAARLPPRKLLSHMTFQRRSTVGEMERPAAQDDADGVPFPQHARRRTMEAPSTLISLCRGLRASFSAPPGRLPSSPSSESEGVGGTTPGAAPAHEAAARHDSWATADGINSQTEMFNRMSSARLRAKLKKEGPACAAGDDSLRSRPQSEAGRIRTRRTRPPANSDHMLRPDAMSWSPPNFPPRRSFTLEALRPCFSGNSSHNEAIDVNSMLWDTDGGEDR